MFRIYRTETAAYPAVYLLTAVPEADEAICRRLFARAFSLVSVSVPDWNADLSPWPAPRAFRQGEDFAGQADVFLCTLIDSVQPCLRLRQDAVDQRT